MKMNQILSAADLDVLERKLRDFIPARIYDIHVHLLDDRFVSPQHRWHSVPVGLTLDSDVYHQDLQRWMPVQRTGSLYFGDPTLNNDRPGLNEWVAGQAAKDGPYSRSLAIVSPVDDPEAVERSFHREGHIGLKPYHVYAGQPDTTQAEVEDFAPEWMWDLCHRTSGILMMHLMRDRAIADPRNQQALRRLCKAYPHCRLVLAHIARSFNYRHALEGLHTVADLENVWLDTSAVAESPAFVKAMELFDTERILFGTDYPICQMRGKATAVGDRFYWIYDTDMPGENDKRAVNLCGIESLVALREACEQKALTKSQVEGIFHDNAFGLLAPHVSPPLLQPSMNGHALVI